MRKIPAGAFLNHPIMWVILLLCAAASTCLAAGPEEASRTPMVYLVDHDIHTSFVLDRTTIPKDVIPEKEDFPNDRFLEVSIGPDEIFRTSEFSWKNVAVALFLPSPNILRLGGFKGSVEQEYPGSDWISMKVEPQQLRALLIHIHLSFRRVHGEKTAAVKSNFYSAEGEYHLFNNCNTWTAKGFEAMGRPLPFTTTFSSRHLLNSAKQYAYTINESKKRKLFPLLSFFWDVLLGRN